MTRIKFLSRLSAMVVLAAAFAFSAQAQTAFGSLNIGTSSTVTTVTVPVTTAGSVGAIAVVTGGKSGLDYTNTGAGSCSIGNPYSVGGSCTVTVKFTPQFSGSRNGAVVLTDSTGLIVLGTAYLSGTGIGAQIIYASNPQILPNVNIPNGSTYFNQAYMDPNALAVDGNGDVFYGNSDMSPWFEVYELTPTTPGNYNVVTIDEDAETNPQLNPLGEAVDGAGNLYVGSGGPWNSFTPSALVYTRLPGGAYSAATQLSVAWDDPVNSTPGGIGVDPVGNVYISDQYSGDVYKLTLQSNGTYVQTTIATALAGPWGAAVDGNGNVYVLQNFNGQVVKLSPPASGVTYNQTVIDNNYGGGLGITVDGNGNVWIGTYGDPELLTPPTVGTLYNEISPDQGSGLAVYSIAIDATGNVYMGDGNTGNVYELPYATVPTLSFANTAVGSISADSPQTITVVDFGNKPLKFADIDYPVDFPEAAGVPSDCPILTSIAVMQTCTLTINFAPVVSGPIADTLLLSDNALNGQYTQQNLPLIGVGIGPTINKVFWTGPAQITYGASMLPVLNATASVPGTFAYTLSGGMPVTPATILPVGNYQLGVVFTPTGPGGVLHTGIRLFVVPAPLTVTANNLSVTYNSQIPSSYGYTMTGFIGSDTPASSVTGVPTITTTATARGTKVYGVSDYTSTVGTYALNPTFGSLKSANYSFTFVPGTLTITPATTPLTITATNVNIMYASSVPATYRYTVTGLLGFDSATTAGTGTPSITCPATTNSGAGNYTITAAPGTFSAPNYSGVNYVNGTLTIVK